jgi:Zn-finger nucleic acid-binding protein
MRVSSGPYRVADAPSLEEIETRCPYCGNVCPALVRVCPHCDVRLDNVRCAACYTLQPPGSFSCGRCGQSLDLEPVLDPTDAPCPRCRTPLELARGDLETAGRVHECPRCGGLFVSRDVLADILTRAELGGPLPPASAPKNAMLDAVTYLPCPTCRTSMNRVNFGRLSGVIVDVCKKHGTWFDAGELTRVIAFASAGGMAKARAREIADKKDEVARTAQVHVESMRVINRDEMADLVNEWRFFLDLLFP